MLTTPIPKLIGSLAVPTVISQLVTTIYNLADTYFVSQINRSASAAVGVVFSLMSIIQAVGFGLGIGAGSIIARRLGGGEKDEADRCASSAFVMELAAGTLILIGGLIFLYPLMRLLGSTDTMLPYAAAYAHDILLAAPLVCAAYSLNSMLRAQGKAKFAMVGLSFGAVLNIGLDPFLMFQVGLGIRGAAIATALSQSVSFLILLGFFLSRISAVRLKGSLISKKGKEYLLIFTTGFPAMCRQGLASFASALLNQSAAVYGDAAVSAITIANKMYLFVRNVVIGIGQGFQPVAGYNYGAGDKKRTRESFLFTVKAGTVLCVVAALLFFLNAEGVFELFRKGDEAVREIGVPALRYACLVMPFLAYSTYVNQFFQSLGFSARSTLLSCCRQGICFVPALLILRTWFGLSGLQAVQPLADGLTFLVSVPFQIRLFQKELRTDGSKNN